MKILVTGGCGYVGSVLVPRLLDKGHRINIVDAQWFGNFLDPHPSLHVLKRDIREKFSLEEIDAVIHLAGVANDPCGELDAKLSWEVNVLATAQLLQRAADAGVKQFIYASSGSVYGVSDAPQVTEDTPLLPLSDYNKTKLCAERLCLSYADRMAVQIVRPATVCGYSPRMRLDVVVNMLTMQAMTKGEITVFGGDQMRPNIHINDMCGVYEWMLSHPELTGIYNAGFENLTVMEIAEKIASIKDIPPKITVTTSMDPRSYRMNSDKLLATGFKQTEFVDTAITGIIEAMMFKRLRDENYWYNLRMMKLL